MSEYKRLLAQHEDQAKEADGVFTGMSGRHTNDIKKRGWVQKYKSFTIPPKSDTIYTQDSNQL